MEANKVRYEDIKEGDIIRYSSLLKLDGTTEYADLRVIEVGRTRCHSGHSSDCRWWATVEAIDEASAQQTYKGRWNIAHCLIHPAAAHGKLVVTE